VIPGGAVVGAHTCILLVLKRAGATPMQMFASNGARPRKP
jgi:hypothetical protein